MKQYFLKIFKWSDTAMAFWAVVFALGSLVVSLFSYCGSERALDYSEKFFVLENRPWIKLKLYKDERSNLYHTVFKKGENVVVVEYRCDVENVGKQPAKKVSFDVTANLGKSELPLNDKLLPLVDLAPGDIEPLCIGIRYKADKNNDLDSLESRVKKQIEEQGVIVNIIANYSSELDSSAKYDSNKKYQIYGARYDILSAESK